MEPGDNWERVQKIFLEAADLAAGQRATFLDRACGDDSGLRREVESLLEQDPQEAGAVHAAIGLEAASLLEPQPAREEPDPDLRWLGQRLGAYRVESIAGHGGMGAVYRASRDDAEFQQQVAIKLVRPAMQSAHTLQSFKQERQILARLAHPNIGRLLDGGSSSDGVPYLVMEFIEGEAITGWCRRQSLSIEERLRLFLQVCEGVEFAHDHLVVHRDLKPANILITADGTVKLLDFGIAKMLAPDAAAGAATALGIQAMTPEYAAPEQVRGEPISKAVDIYALGLILYEILTGHKAQPIPDLSPDTVARVVCQMEPVPPAAFEAALAGDLDNIIRMALRKEPPRRYASAADLANDIRRHLEKRPVLARPDTLAYRAAKFLNRNRATAAGALVTAIVFTGLAVGYWITLPGSAPRVLRVTQITQGGRVNIGGGLAADRSYVYFVERTPGESRLVRVPVRGGPPEPVSGTLRHPEILDISPDRAELLVSNGLDDDAPLWAAPVNGGAPRRIGNVSGHAAAWSPDARQIVFGNLSSLFMVNSDGNGARKLLDVPGRPDNVRWAPGRPSTRLRYAVGKLPNLSELWEVRSDGAHPHLLLPNRDGAELQKTGFGIWIAGGKYYLFHAEHKDTFGFWAMKEGRGFLRSAGPHPIHSSPTDFAFPAASPDGMRV